MFSVEEQATLLGNRLVFSPRRAVCSDIEDSNLRQAVLADAHFAYVNQQPTSKSYSVSGNVIEVFFNVIQPPVPIVIFGAGHDAA